MFCVIHWAVAVRTRKRLRSSARDSNTIAIENDASELIELEKSHAAGQVSSCHVTLLSHVLSFSRSDLLLLDFCSAERFIEIPSTGWGTPTSMIKIVIRRWSGKVKGLNLNFHRDDTLWYIRGRLCARMNASLYREEVTPGLE